MFFIAANGLPAGAMMTCRGPFRDLAEARTVAEAIIHPGEYTIYGPGVAVHGVVVSPPQVKSGAIAN
nr:MAG TPA: hypothetical protein [Caudoviricetes sp.]